MVWNLRVDLHEKAWRLAKKANCWRFTDQNLAEISFPGMAIKAGIGLRTDFVFSPLIGLRLLVFEVASGRGCDSSNSRIPKTPFSQGSSTSILDQGDPMAVCGILA